MENQEVKAESHRNFLYFEQLNSSITKEVKEAIYRVDEYHKEEIIKLDKSDHALKLLQTLEPMVQRLCSNMD